MHQERLVDGDQWPMAVAVQSAIHNPQSPLPFNPQ
jgi:hypothetical protein